MVVYSNNFVLLKINEINKYILQNIKNHNLNNSKEIFGSFYDLLSLNMLFIQY